MATPRAPHSFFTRVLMVAVLFTVGTTMLAWACETPVYRYAMYRWEPTPYEVYFLHDQPASDRDQRVQERLADFERGSDRRANVVCIPVDLAADPELKALPPDVRKAWLDREEKSLPSYFVSNPYGAGLAFESFDETSVESLVDSPARQRLAEQLATGKLGVFVMVTGSDAAENAATEKLLQDLVEEVRSGKVSLYTAPSENPADEKAAEGSEDGTPPNLELGFEMIDRANEAERWFVRALLAVEPELVEETRPLVYLTYGRGRALLPYIGKGITRENLLREIEFISGACSCTVKEQNPGADLLVRFDWDTAATALAEKFGNEEGAEGQFGPEMFLPELIIPGRAPSGSTDLAETQIAQTSADASLAEPASDDLTPADESTADSLAPGTEDAVADDPATTKPVPTQSPELANLPPSPAPVTDATHAATDSSLTSIWIVGAGVVVGLLILFGLTFVVLRPE